MVMSLLIIHVLRVYYSNLKSYLSISGTWYFKIFPCIVSISSIQRVQATALSYSTTFFASSYFVVDVNMSMNLRNCSTTP
jgi:hypothetical protein